MNKLNYTLIEESSIEDLVNTINELKERFSDRDEESLGWYSTKTLAEKLNISERTLFKYRKHYGLKHSQVNGKVFYSKEDVDDFFKGFYSKAV